MKKRRRRRTTPVAGELIGGRARLPLYVAEPAPFRPDAIVWIEGTSGFVLSLKVVQPTEPVTTAVEHLLEAMTVPKGATLRPLSIRVADAALAQAIRERLGDAMPVRVAPTPEVDRLLRRFVRDMGGPGGPPPSYLAGGRISSEAVDRFFAAAASVYRTAPWRVVASEDQLLCLDCPAVGFKDAPLTIIGKLGIDLGLLVFESVGSYEKMASQASRHIEGLPLPTKRHTPALSVTFVKESLPEVMAREAVEHGWVIAGRFPVLLVFESDGVVRLQTEQDVRLAAALCHVVVDFFSRHADIFTVERPQPARVSFILNELEGKPSGALTAPHPQYFQSWAESLQKGTLRGEG